jgi:hypothetical protein
MTNHAKTLIRWHANHLQSIRGGWTKPAVALARAATARRALAIELQRARRP